MPVDDVIQMVGLFCMLCHQEYRECDNVGCHANTSGKFCTIDEPIEVNLFWLGMEPVSRTLKFLFLVQI